MCNFQEKNISSLFIRGNVFTFQIAHGNLLIFCQMVLHPNINFLISKKTRHQKLIQNVEAINWYCYSQTRPVFYRTKQTFIIKYK